MAKARRPNDQVITLEAVVIKGRDWRIPRRPYLRAAILRHIINAAEDHTKAFPQDPVQGYVLFFFFFS